MVAFAANSLLCREALASGDISASVFTLIRLASGGVVLFILVSLSTPRIRSGITAAGSWRSALALFVYAAGFSFAYVSLGAATGALILFGAVQLTMMLSALWSGDRFSGRQVLGFVLAAGGLFWFLLPGARAPSLSGSVLMLAAGVACGLYSLWGRGERSPLLATCGNFVRSVPVAAALLLLTLSPAQLNPKGVLLALASGAVASGLGYALWYRILPALRTTDAAMVQLSVPVIAAVGGWLFLGEVVSLRLSVAAFLVLGGIGLFILSKKGKPEG